jgi:transposase
MKMCDHSGRTTGAEVDCSLVPRARSVVGRGDLQAPPTVAPTLGEHASQMLTFQVSMPVVHERGAGLDVHKKTVVACVLTPDGQGDWCQETRTVGTMTVERLARSDWLQRWDCTHVAMESTGEYWKPLVNILAGNCDVWLVKAPHVKAVPGRKTDVTDAEWLAALLQHGLWRASFMPPVAQRELRHLTRYRSTCIRERATLATRVQKVWADANSKLGSVASDVLGVSGRALLEAVMAGQTDLQALADLAKGRLRDTREPLVNALEGRVKPHRVVLTELLWQLDSLEETIARFDEQSRQLSVPFEEAVGLWDTIPGVARRTAAMLVAEIGTDMSRLASAAELASWAGVAPGNHESAGTRQAGKTRKGNRILRTVLTQAAPAAARTNATYLSAQYRRLAARRGKQKAMMAVAHSILVMAYDLILRKEPYREAGADYCDSYTPEATAQRLIKRLEALGYPITIQQRSAGAIA